MNTAAWGWFEVQAEDCPNGNAWEFIVALCAHGTEWMSFGISPENGFFQPNDDLITLGISISDKERNVELRALRIDFCGSTVVLGEDETHQYVTKLNSENQGVVAYEKHNASPADYAELAARWLAVEMARIIERHEWIKLFYRHTKYVMADIGTCISWSDTRNKKRFDLGPPTRIEIVHPAVKKTGTSAS